MSGKSRTFLGVLYPDSESYDCSAVLERLSCVFQEWAYVLHDADTDENGELKKPHIHWIGKLENATSLTAISDGKHLGVSSNSIEYCKNWKFAVRYLIHKDSPDKFQYPQQSIKSNFDFAFFLRDKDAEIASVRKIRTYLFETQCTSVQQLMDWCLENGCWSEFRRCFVIWSCVMREFKEDFIHGSSGI